MFVKYLYNFRYRIIVHAALMTLTMVGTIVLIVLVIQNNNDTGSLTGSSEAHYVIGIIVLAWVVAQVLMGVLLRVLLYFIINPMIIFVLRKVHMYSGIVLILLGKVNVIIGWAMKGSAVGLGVCCAFMAVFIILLLLYIYFVSGSMANEVFVPRPVSLYNDRMIAKDGYGGPLMNLPNQSVVALMSLPYCWAQVRAANLFVFNDLVYALPDIDFHPGGRKVIEEIRGR